MTVGFLRKHRKFFLAAVAFLLLAGLVLAFLHHHEDGKDEQQCAVCHFVKHLVYFFVLMVTLLGTLLSRAFSFVPPKKLTSLLLDSSLHGRSPPVLS